MELLDSVPETPHRIQQELAIQLGLGVSLQFVKGWAAPEVERVYGRARELCRQMGESAQMFMVLVGLYAFYLVRAELDAARELAQQLLSIAQGRQDAALLVRAHHAMGESLYMQGEFAQGRTHFERASSLYEPIRHRSLAAIYGVDFGVHSLQSGGWTLWNLGYPDQAVVRVEEALTLARKLSHATSLVLALLFSGLIHAMRGEGEAALKTADALVLLATEEGARLGMAWGICIRGRALIQQAQAEEGVRQLREGLASARATGAEVMQTYWLAAIAEGCARAGGTEDGLAAVTEALAAVERTGERLNEAELYRLNGELMLRLGSSDSKVEEEAEKCFRPAIEIARKQRAKSFELRATASLARLRARQGRRDEGRTMLADIYGWFTEGFDTADLKDAKGLLEELGT